MPKQTKDACFADLARRILSTELPPGLDLDEARMAAQYGMSRTPMREVLQRLAGAGYIRLEDNRGAKVASMDVAALRTFFQTAPMIYAGIARLAAENRSPEQLDQLKAAQMRFRTATDARDTGAAALANHRFHACIGDMAHNHYLLAALDRLLIDHTRLSHTFYRPASAADEALIATAADQHDGMIDAIEARDPARATQLTLRHWDLSRDRLDLYARPDPLPIAGFDIEERRNAV